MPPETKSPFRQYLAIMVLLQAIMYAGIWLWDEYVASYITIVFPAIILVVIILSRIADWIEPSRIPRWYYGFMLLSAIIPLVIGAIFYFIYSGRIDWLQ